MEVLDDDPIPEELYLADDDDIKSFKPGSAKDGFPCGVCGKIFFSISSLSTHMRFHANDRPFKCSLCDKSYVTSSHLRRHFYNAHPPTDIHNEIPVKKSQGSKSLAIIAAPKLTRGYYSDETVKTDEEVSIIETIELKSNPIAAVFTDVKATVDPPKIKTLNSKNSSVAKSFTPTAGNSSQCQHCSKVFANPHYLKVHLRFHTGERPYQCTLCPSSFITASHLRRHERQLHNYDKNSFIKFSDPPRNRVTKVDIPIPSTSDISNYLDTTEESFSQPNFDENSVTSLSNENNVTSFTSLDENGLNGSNSQSEEFLTKDMWDKQTVCQFCDKKFNYPGQLKVHLRFHKGDRPFECPDCNKTYITASHLKRHRLSAHNVHFTKPKSVPTKYSSKRQGDGYFCSFCSITFEGDSQLQIHNYQFHPLEAGTDDYSDDMSQSVIMNDSCMIDLTEEQTPEDEEGEEEEEEIVLPNPEVTLPTEKSNVVNSVEPPMRRGKKRKRKLLDTSLECEFCNKTFQSRLVLRIHKRLHKNERPHKCEFCDESFTLKSLWQQHRSEVHNCEIEKITFPSFNEHHLRGHGRNNFLYEPQFQLLGEELNYIQGVQMRNTPLRSQNSSKTNVDNNPFAVECHLCYKKFSSVNYLKVHLRYHGGIKPYKCHVCNKAFTTKSHLNRHKLSKVHQNMEYTLSFTSRQIVIQRQQLSENIYKQTPNYIPKYLCTECGRHCRSPAALEIHLRFHKGEKPFVCEYCHRRFTTKSHLKRHKVQVHGLDGSKNVLMLQEEPLEDKDDNFFENSLHSEFDSGQEDSQQSLSFSEKDNDDLKTSKHELPCPVCSKVFYFPANLRVHMRFHTKERPYRCRICLKSYIINSHLRRHLRQAHNVPWNSLPKDSFKRSASDIHSYSPPPSPTEPQPRIIDRMDEEEASYTCHICFKQLDTESLLHSHLSTHNGTRQYKCNFCPLAYTTRSHLIRHQRTIHRYDSVSTRSSLPNLKFNQVKKEVQSEGSENGQVQSSADLSMDSSVSTEPATASASDAVSASLDSLRCHFCNKQFKSRANLEIHLRFHTGSKPYKCQTCGSCFTIISHLKRHQLKVHQASPTNRRKELSPTIKSVMSLNDKSEDMEGTLHDSVLIKKVKTEQS